MSDIILKPSERQGLRVKRQIQKPRMYDVIFLNDDYTPAKHVVKLLTDHFNKRLVEAWALALEVHHQKRAVVGNYPYEVAEEKVAIVDIMSRAMKHPFRAEMTPT